MTFWQDQRPEFHVMTIRNSVWFQQSVVLVGLFGPFNQTIFFSIVTHEYIILIQDYAARGIVTDIIVTNIIYIFSQK